MGNVGKAENTANMGKAINAARVARQENTVNVGNIGKAAKVVNVSNVAGQTMWQMLVRRKQKASGVIWSKETSEGV